MTPEQETYKEYGFNPRTHESATVDDNMQERNLDVSIHALMRVRPRLIKDTHRLRVVSIHALMRVRLFSGTIPAAFSTFQSTHS